LLVSLLCRFLLDMFGRERLREGTGVLDIAGGKGDLAFELVNLNNIPATVVDPRPLKLDKRLTWLKVDAWPLDLPRAPAPLCALMPSS
jgi:hypothetical protein